MELKELIEKLNATNTNKKLFGLVVYEIAGNGCLNGMWSNNFSNGIFMQEIARKIKNKNDDEISGEYFVSYIEPEIEPIIGKLTIEKNNDETYNLKWHHLRASWEKEETDPSIVFEGIGMKTGEKQLTVFYWGIEN